MNTQRIIRQYYLLLTLQRCAISMTMAIYPTFLLSNGLNLLQMNLVNLVFFVTMFVCEIPTGAFADVFGRKRSFVVSCGLFALATLTYAFSTAFWQFAIAEVLAAVAATFSTGAFESWLVDMLTHHGYNRKNLHPIFARASQYGTVAGILAALAGAMLFDCSHMLPWLAESALFVVTGTLAFLTMKEEYFVHTPLSFVTGLNALKDTVRASITYGIKNKSVRFVMLLVLALNFTTMAPNMQWQPLFKQWLPDQTSLGYLWAGMALALMAGASLSKKLMDVLGERKAMLLCHVGTAAGIAGTVVFGLFVPALSLFLFHEIWRGAFGPIKDAYLHDNIPSEVRSTVVSFGSISHHIGGAVGLIASGTLAEYGSMSLAWIVSGGTLLAITLFLWRNGK